MHSPICLCALAVVPTNYHKLPLKTICWGEDSSLLEHENVIEEWEGWPLYPNDDAETWPDVVEDINQHPPMQKLLPHKTNTTLHWPYNGRIWPIEHPLLLATLHTTIDVIYAKSKIKTYVVVGTKKNLRSLYQQCVVEVSSFCIMLHNVFIDWQFAFLLHFSNMYPCFFFVDMLARNCSWHKPLTHKGCQHISRLGLIGLTNYACVQCPKHVLGSAMCYKLVLRLKIVMWIIFSIKEEKEFNAIVKVPQIEDLLVGTFVTLLRSITMLHGIDNIMHTIPSLRLNAWIFHIILSVPQNIVMALNEIILVVSSQNNKWKGIIKNALSHLNISSILPQTQHMLLLLK